ncbi:hypothetical protein [Marinomonas sp. GJ51-6]|uniref:hypothetical protein n=1 Tax=Marinomonas sp. GJ51-6 TaxID=2992802 RepID=UPI0029349732|nr:hypothetical protein [Marinomonas sp. GJ51-6]WOD08666.1 hypothetical protein ONZ50_06165 [Marinomonas sp. GJ51-6]
MISTRHWIIAGGLAVSVHAGAFYAAFYSVPEGSENVGYQGIEFGLGMVGDLGVASDTSVAQEEVQEVEETEIIEPDPIVEPEPVVEPEPEPVVEPEPIIEPEARARTNCRT